MIYYEEEINYKPILKTAKELLKKRGYIDCCSILDEGTISVVCTDYDNWNGGTYGYTIYVSLPVSQYSAYTSDRINEFESEISKTFNEVIKADNNSSFITQISPCFSPKDIDPTIIGGEVGKKELLSKIEEISNLLIKVATGGPSFDLVDGDYKKLYNWLSNKLKTLNLDNPNPYFSLWDWYHYYSPNLQRWQDRRLYINELYKPLKKIISDITIRQSGNPIVIDLTPWDRIRRTYAKILADSSQAKIVDEFQTVGLLCREIIISLGQLVYNKDIYGAVDSQNKPIGKTDGFRMLEAYFTYKLHGTHFEEYRAYAKTTNKLANALTHERNATKKDMMLSVSATTALVNIVGILEEQYI